jgi:hypothetical protein
MHRGCFLRMRAPGWRRPAAVAVALLAVLALAGCGVTVSFGAAASPSPGAPSAHRSSTPHLSRPIVHTVTVEPPTRPDKPPGQGFLGVTVTNPPADWTVSGCEVVNVLPNTPAAEAGMVGRDNRIDPVGDVIAEVSAPALGRVAVSNCAELESFLKVTHPGQALTIHYWHRQVFIFGHWVARRVTVTLAASAGGGVCPPPIRGNITGAASGNRIAITVQLVGPQAAVTIPAILDTGADTTVLPNTLLRDAGFKPYATGGVSGVVPGASTSDYLYVLPPGSLRIDDQGTWVPLTDGSLDPVAGIHTLSGGSLDRLIGPDVLKLGAALVVSGRTWTLTPPCTG